MLKKEVGQVLKAFTVDATLFYLSTKLTQRTFMAAK